MMEITAKNAQLWSKMGSRAMFGQAILALAGETKKDLMVLSADLGSSSGLSRFKDAYPNNFLNVGISEQNMIGVAAGLAKEGSVVFATSFAPFLSLRAGEQIRMEMGYMGLNVKAVALGGGLALGFLGNSHYGLEDASIMRSIPNLTVVQPADCVEIIKTVYAAAEFSGPMYIRLTGETNNPVVYEADYHFEIGKAITLREGKDVAIFAAGTMVYASLQAAKILEERGISASVVNMHTLKPLDYAAIDRALASAKLIVSVEENTVIGGLGGAIAEYKTTFRSAPPQLLLGLPDCFGEVAEHKFLLDKYGLTGPKIADSVAERLKT